MDFHETKRFDAVSEKDVDLLLLEEFWCNEHLCDWFYRQLRAARPDLPDLDEMKVEAARSVSGTGADGRPGETDLLVVLRGRSGHSDLSVAILIEDKVSAAFTDEQSERYRSRADRMRGEFGYSHAATVLIAPKMYSYSAANGVFDLVMPLDDVWKHLLERSKSLEGELKRRTLHRALMLERVCSGRHRYSAGVNPHEVNTIGIETIEEYIANRDSRLRPKRRAVRGAKSGGPNFDLPFKDTLRDAAKSAGLTGTFELNFYWYLLKGEMCISFHNWRGFVDGMHAWFAPRLMNGMRLKRAAKGNTVYLLLEGLPAFDTTIDFESQRESIDCWIATAVELQNWFARLAPELQSWISTRKFPLSGQDPTQ